MDVDFQKDSLSDKSRSGNFGWLTSIALLAIIALVYVTVNLHSELSERDLYRVVVGLIDGELHGTYLASPMHYGRIFSFGYIWLYYALAGHGIINHPVDIMALMDGIGMVSAILMAVFTFTSTYVLFGTRTARMALIIFALSPVMLAQALSGHQILLAGAFLLAAATLMFAPTGPRLRIACTLLAFLLLAAGSTIRSDIFFCYPWLILAQPRATSIEKTIKDGLIRLIPALLSIMVYFHLVNSFSLNGGSTAGGASSFLAAFYSVKNMVQGSAICVIAVGAVTLLLLAVFAFNAARHSKISAIDLKSISACLYLLGPVALILFNLLLWLPNPIPHRHFLFVSLGFSLILGILLANREGAWKPLAFAFLVVLGNQLVVQIAGMGMSHFDKGYINIPARLQWTNKIPVGQIYHEKALITQRRQLFRNFFQKLPEACSDNLVVFTDEGFQAVTDLFDARQNPDLKFLQPYANASLNAGVEGVYLHQGRHSYIFLTTLHDSAGFNDEIHAIVTNPSLSGYSLIIDPYSTRPDMPLPPPDRRTQMTCKAAA
jgi:hypothetical protein